MRSGLQGTAPATLKKMNTKRNNTTHASTNGNTQQHRNRTDVAAVVAVWLSGKAQHTTNNAVITTAIQLRSDYDVSRTPASIQREQKNEHVNFSS